MESLRDRDEQTATFDDTGRSDSRVSGVRERVQRILLVDDVSALGRVMQRDLRRLGRPWMLDHALTGAQGLVASRETTYDIAVVDLDLGSEPNGCEVLQAMRERGTRTLRVAWSGAGGSESRIAAFTAGADDFVHKGPAGFAELWARLEVLLVRGANRTEHVCGRIRVDALTGEAFVSGELRRLTQTSWKLLLCMVQFANEVVSSPLLYDASGIQSDSDGTNVRSAVRKLREQLGPDGGSQIITIPGAGYGCFAPEEIERSTPVVAVRRIRRRAANGSR